ncbi:PP2C family protein-serine/threonine phosphatase, partial [bacterium]|nr:PP2C family protein-serine/threonine phosphatase [bacterium]
GAVGTELILEPYKQPSSAVQRAEDVYEYQMDQGKFVYDIVTEAVFNASDNSRDVGAIHLLLDKTVVDGNVKLARQKVILIFGLVLIFGYLGVFLLVYVTMSPFKKLLQWIRALGRDEIHEEMEFDSSDEVGQIAQAFNDITEKFRKSQVNLAERERLQKEMQVAQEIQHALLPSTFPEIEGYEIASYYEAAKEVGGDYFDFVDVDKDTLGIVVADVSGKGVPGSLIMTMIRTALRTEARGNWNAADVLARVTDLVINDMKRGLFVTVFYIILDSRHRTINYASAGHNPMILYRGKTKKSFYLNPRGFPIGINLPDNTLFRKSIQSDTLRLREDDILIVYTDGITEAMNQRREKFGDERLLSTIRNYGHFQVDPLIDKIRNEINSFSEGYAQSDDITLVAIKEKLKAEDVLFNLRIRLMKMVNEEGLSIKEACKNVGVSPSTYYKYKKRFKKMGLNGLKEKVIWSDIEEKHISIEDKVKIYDIIKEHPEYGAKRICEELNTLKYGNTIVDDKRIYDE